jgi:hypothetical protein
MSRDGYQRRKHKMKIKFMALAMALLMVAGFSLSSTAGSVTDTDSDSIPDDYDNCDVEANGPALGARNQADSDGDGLGNVCDADYTQDNVILGDDFGIIILNFGSANEWLDLTGDGVILGDDFGKLILLFGTVPVSSGLACVDPTINIPGNIYASAGTGGTDSPCVAAPL